MELRFRNVNDAFRGVIEGIETGGIPTVRSPSRNGDVLMIPEPLTITYERPTERVLFNPSRDANPFFHLFESLWMLAGRNDLAPLEHFVSTFGNFSDDGKTFNGAYGYRWRHPQGRYTLYERLEFCEGVDQLSVLIEHLKVHPESRRAVLAMWNVEDDLMKVGVGDFSKDVCCNLSACFSIRDTGICKRDHADPNCPCVTDGHDMAKVLDMTVFNRSNDLIWGTLGANAVHFSFLQEYMATALGVGVGVYHQISNNAHVYTERYEATKWITEDTPDFTFENSVPFVQNRERFDVEVKDIVSLGYGPDVDRILSDTIFSEPFIEGVAKKMFMAFAFHKKRDYKRAFAAIGRVFDEPWREAGTTWLEKRRYTFNKKVNGG